MENGDEWAAVRLLDDAIDTLIEHTFNDINNDNNNIMQDIIVVQE